MNPRLIAEKAQKSSLVIAAAETERKNAALSAMAEFLSERKADIVAANKDDLAEAEAKGLPANVIHRLGFGVQKVESRVRALHKIAALPDPVGQTFYIDERPNGLQVEKVRVPLGVVLMVYEARPHVTVNAGAFCLKSGNAAILRGGSEAKRCNALLGEFCQESLREVNLPADAVQVISGSHDDIDELLQLDSLIDLVIPRGGKELIKAVSSRSQIPVIKHFEGICHVYIDRDADIDKAIDIVVDSKCLMPEVCNAAETLLVCETRAHEVPGIVETLERCGVAVKGCERTRKIAPSLEPATEEDWRAEYLDMMLSVKVVSGLNEAIDHINRYGSGHTDTIITSDSNRAQEFVNRVDSAVVLVNASTMFCDGETLGMGAEIGISTDKLHARGPMGLQELTSYKHVVRGTGQVMGNPKELIRK